MGTTVDKQALKTLTKPMLTPEPDWKWKCRIRVSNHTHYQLSKFEIQHTWLTMGRRILFEQPIEVGELDKETTGWGAFSGPGGNDHWQIFFCMNGTEYVMDWTRSQFIEDDDEGTLTLEIYDNAERSITFDWSNTNNTSASYHPLSDY